MKFSATPLQLHLSSFSTDWRFPLPYYLVFYRHAQPHPFQSFQFIWVISYPFNSKFRLLRVEPELRYSYNFNGLFNWLEVCIETYAVQVNNCHFMTWLNICVKLLKNLFLGSHTINRSFVSQSVFHFLGVLSWSCLGDLISVPWVISEGAPPSPLNNTVIT